MATFVPYMFAPALVGILLDRFNKGSVLSVGITTAMLSMFILSFTSSVIDVMLVRAVAGIAHAFFWPSTVAIVTSAVSQEQRVQTISRFTMAWGRWIHDRTFDRHIPFRAVWFQTAL